MSPSTAEFSEEWDYAVAERVGRVGEWDQLFDALERAGCELGVEGRLRAFGLLGRLVAAGADLTKPDLLQAHLVPIVATGPDKVAEIADVIGRCMAQTSSRPMTGWRYRSAQRAAPDAISVVLRADRRSRRWLAFGAAVALALLLVWAIRWFPLLSSSGSGPHGVAPSIEANLDWQSRLEDVAIRLVFTLPVVFFGLLLAGWPRAAGDRLVRRAGNADWSELFTLAAQRIHWFAASDARRLFEALKQKLSTLTDRIDVSASVRATLRAGMSPDIRYQTAQERSNYVVLVDRRSVGDHIELLLQSLVAALAAAKIRFTPYEFRGRPAFCTPQSADGGADEALSFTTIAKRHAGERLMLISDGEGLFQPPGWHALRNRQRIFVPPGTPVAEMSRLRDFGHAVLLTPTPWPTWGQREQMLRNLGFLVVPANAEGINWIGQHIARGGEELAGTEPASTADDPFISDLCAKALRYASDIPPPPEEIANLVTDLRIWLARTMPDDPLRPGRSFLVLCGVAAFPAIAPGLTMQVAQLLSRSEGGNEASVDSGILAPLARLPWLRDGRLPDWLRIALLNSLNEEDFDKIRKLQLAVLAEAQPASGPVDAAGLERIAAAFEVAVGKSVVELNEAAARVGPGLPGQEVERIFLAVLHGERLDPVHDVIAPEAPEAIRERLEAPERRRRAVWVAVTVITAGAVALAEPVLAGWIAAGWNALATFASTRSFSAQVAGFNLLPWLGVAPTIFTAGCLAGWLVAALRRRADRGAHVRLLKILRVLAVLAIAPPVAYVFVDPAAARMPLLFAVSAATFLWFAPTSRTAGARSAADMLPVRLEGDDWIATSLGSVVVAALALGPVFLLALPVFADPSKGFTLQLAAFLVGATSWGFGLRYVRRQLLGPVEGRSTPHERWLDFIAPALSLLLIASVAPILLSLGDIHLPFLDPTTTRTAPVWFTANVVIGLSFVLLSLRLSVKDAYVLRYSALWVMFVALGNYYWGTILSFDNSPISKIIFVIVSICLSFCALTREILLWRFIVRTLALGTYWCLWIAAFFLIVPENLDRKLYSSVHGQDLIAFFFIVFLPAIAVFWPNLRFILMARSSPDPSPGFKEPPLQERVKGVFKTAMASAWWFVPALWLVSLRYHLLGVYIAAAPLAVPLAIVAGSRCGVAATIPVLVGSLSFVAQADLLQDSAIASPGGFWPIVVLPLLARLFGDEAMRRRIFGRTRASLWDCAIFVLYFAAAVPKTALDPAFAVLVDPSSLAAAAGFLVGASRMRWREPAIAFVASIGFALIPELGHLSLQVFQPGPWVSAAAFFGGRVCRSFVLPKPIADSRSSAVFGMLLMISAIAVAYAPEMLPSLITGRPIPPGTVLLLLVLVGGIVLRKSPSLALVTWTAAAMLISPWAYLTLREFPAPISGAAAAGVLICSAAFAVLGYQISRRGEAVYARALGVLVQPTVESSDFYNDRDRGGAQAGGSEKRFAA